MIGIFTMTIIFNEQINNDILQINECDISRRMFTIVHQYRRIRSPHTLVNDRTRSVFLHIRPYFVVLHGSVLRS